MSAVQHLRGKTFHGRKGAVSNQFSYGIDYVLLDADACTGPALFSRNAANLAGVHDRDHGGAPGAGRGAVWAREVLAAHGLPPAQRLLLLTQPRMLGHVFNPVSFWLCYDAADGLRVVIAEVSNTFGQRHSYLCHRDDLGPISREDTITAQKIFYVSPFQPIAGDYAFRFDIGPARIGIWIDYTGGNGGVIATLTGRLAPLTSAGILAALLRRPFGARRVVALIFWQALKLRIKGALYRSPPKSSPEQEVSR